jgi:hypothetical protein
VQSLELPTPSRNLKHLLGFTFFVTLLSSGASLVQILRSGNRVWLARAQAHAEKNAIFTPFIAH